MTAHDPSLPVTFCAFNRSYNELPLVGGDTMHLRGQTLLLLLPL